MSDLLKDILILDFSQFLSGPSASLRMADLGARVIKIERPDTGDICRELYVSNVIIDGESSVFHAINRNKQSYAADLKNEKDLAKVRKLIAKADVVMHNFRPGVMKRLGLDYEQVSKIKPDIVYGEITGYGNEGPWKDKPGQDLLLQSLSGLTWLSGDRDDGPVPVGLAIADILAGSHLVHGILAALVRRGINGQGAHVQVSMLESICDLQFETVTTWYYDGIPPERTASNNAHAYLGAPYGVYQTADGHIALAMGSIPQLGELLECPALLNYPEPASWFTQRDEIKKILADHLKTRTTAQWLSVLEPADIWCADVMDWKRLLQHDGFKSLDMLQTVQRGNGVAYDTTRCPITIDGVRPKSDLGSPSIGEHGSPIDKEFALS